MKETRGENDEVDGNTAGSTGPRSDGRLQRRADSVQQSVAGRGQLRDHEGGVVFLNGITDTYLLSIEGLCSVEDQSNQLEVTCKVGDTEYKKHFLGLSDNVTYFAEQLDGARVSAYHYRVVFKPQTIIPDIDFRGSGRNCSKTLRRTRAGRETEGHASHRRRPCTQDGAAAEAARPGPRACGIDPLAE